MFFNDRPCKREIRAKLFQERIDAEVIAILRFATCKVLPEEKGGGTLMNADVPSLRAILVG